MDIAADTWPQIVRNKGYSPAFIAQVRKARAGAVMEEFRRQGISSFRARGMPQWAREIVLDVSDRRGVSIHDLAGKSRVRKIVQARNEAIYLVKAHKPTISSPQLGKWFNRDHTAILWCVSSYQESANLPRLYGYDVAAARIRKREWVNQNRAKMNGGNDEH